MIQSFERLWAGLCFLSLQISPAASLALTSPAAGESWEIGSTHYVSWRAGGFPRTATVEVSYSTDGGRMWTPVGSCAAERSRVLWKIPDLRSKRCRIRISAAEPRVEHQRLLSILPSREVKSYRWVNVTMSAAFAPRDGAGALVFGGRMWLLGGWNPGDKRHFPLICNNEVWSSADGLHWALVKPNTFLDRTFDPARDWEGRHTAGYVVFRGRMWIVGGDANQGHYQNDVWSSTDGRTWTLASSGSEIPWAPRALHHTLVFRDRIWVLGGQTMPAFAKSGEVFYRDIWTSADGVRWVKVRPREPYWAARGMIGGSVVFRGRIWILGGGTYDTPATPQRKFYHDVWSSPDGVRWTRHVESAPWAPRQYHDVAVYDGRMWVLEGYSQPGGNRNDVWYSSDGVNWYELPNTLWKPRHAASVFVYGGGLWMVAGNNMESDVWKLERAARGEGGSDEEAHQ